jgi:hypothetical protein
VKHLPVLRVAINFVQVAIWDEADLGAKGKKTSMFNCALVAGLRILDGLGFIPGRLQ